MALSSPPSRGWWDSPARPPRSAFSTRPFHRRGGDAPAAGPNRKSASCFASAGLRFAGSFWANVRIAAGRASRDRIEEQPPARAAAAFSMRSRKRPRPPCPRIARRFQLEDRLRGPLLGRGRDRDGAAIVVQHLVSSAVARNCPRQRDAGQRGSRDDLELAPANAGRGLGGFADEAEGRMRPPAVFARIVIVFDRVSCGPMATALRDASSTGGWSPPWPR